MEIQKKTDLNKYPLRKQVEKLSRSDEQSAFLTGGISNVLKFSFFFVGEQKKNFFFFQISRSVGVF
jgi:hypothetical protein